MKKFLFFLVFAFSIVSFSQDIAVKKNQVLFDQVSVATFEKQGDDFKFKSLNNSNSITVTWTYLKISESDVKNFLTITDDAEGKRKSEVKMEYLPSTSNLNMKKAITVLLAKKYNLITVNGVENLDAFFSVERTSITAEAEKGQKENEAIQKELATLDYQLFLRDKLIFSGNIPQDAFTDKYSKEQNATFMNQVVASYNVSMKEDQSPYPVLVVDILSLNGRVLVHAVETGGKLAVALSESKKTFIYKPTYNIDVKDQANQGPFLIQLVNNAYLNGQKFMTLGEAKVLLDVKKSDEVSKFEEAKKKSSNIYEKNGYVVESNGEKFEGLISIDFENLTTSQNGMADLDGGVGSSLKVKGTNKKGKPVIYPYNAKEGVSFVVFNDDGTEAKYRAIYVKIESMPTTTTSDSSVLDLNQLASKSLGLGSLSLGSASWKFFKDIYLSEKINICQDVKNKSFVLELPNKDKGFQILIKKGKEDKFYKKLNEYLGVSLNIDDLEKIDYSNIDGLKDLVDLYSKSI
ncbi:hypothetical protein FNW52_03075 [Flavobacterium sp. ZT3R18]|jgi:hypothetical protein|uniref:hypothetical protein n=1 Tax=Flavobacterium sp. ZT3R18 TaxID=2594429 RepID=UPI001179BBF0|nr:hypothetical protein [Flavobacterium sp. ZT3R18]TRX37898.1 hypothetical protein FNW52_03075 [Flavobacterium sp. ZT3R18]